MTQVIKRVLNKGTTYKNRQKQNLYNVFLFTPIVVLMYQKNYKLTQPPTFSDIGKSKGKYGEFPEVSSQQGGIIHDNIQI